MKDANEVIREFNDIVNMTPSDLETWLKSGDSRSAGWPKEDESGESVGHDSGRKIVEILRANPDKDPEKYTEEQIQHMRKVVSYCKRHLAQEEKANSEKSPEEVKKTKSYASLKNWGHDFLKKKGQENGDEEEAEDKDDDAAEEAEGDDDGEEEEEIEEDGDKTAGDKRKKASAGQSGANKKRETAKGEAKSNGKKNGNDKEENVNDKEDDEDENEEDEEDANDEDEDEEDGSDDSSGNKPKKGPKKGDTVSWNWGNGQPEGKVLDVKGEKTTITTKRGNQVSRDGDPEDPAVVLDTGKSKAIKSNHELND